MPVIVPSMSRALLWAGSFVVLQTVASRAVAAQSDRQSVSGRDVAIYNVAGRVRVESGSGSDVTVEITRGGRDASQLRIANGEVRGRNTLRVIYPLDDDIVYRGNSDSRGRYSSDLNIDRDGTWGNNYRGFSRSDRVRVKSSGSGTEAWADLVVRVPSGKTVSVYLAVGELEANRVDADLRLDVSAARVTATGTRGRLSIDAGSGGVEVRDASGAVVSIDNGSGGVSLSNVQSDQCSIDTGSGGVSGSGVRCEMLSVDVGSGSVRLDDVRSTDAKVDAGSGGVTMGFVNSPKSLSIESGSGTVTVGLPSNLSADVSVETGSGGITSDFAVRTTRVARDELRGTIGDGAGRIRIETGSGSVRLRKN